MYTEGYVLLMCHLTHQYHVLASTPLSEKRCTLHKEETQQDGRAHAHSQRFLQSESTKDTINAGYAVVRVEFRRLQEDRLPSLPPHRAHKSLACCNEETFLTG